MADDTHDRKAGTVGYGRPPVAHRFQPGRSGNPKGRPKAKRSLATMVRAVMGETIPVTLKGRTRHVPVSEAILMRLREQALAGDHKAIRLLLDLHHALDPREEVSGPGTAILSDEDRAILALYLANHGPEDGNV